MSLGIFDHVQSVSFKCKKTQAKLITVTDGEIYDVAVDLRSNSKTFGKYVALKISYKDDFSFYIPAGFAHSYYSFHKENIIYYKLDNYYAPKYESGIVYTDPIIKVKWPKKKMIVSQKDKKLLTFKQFCNKFGGI